MGFSSPIPTVLSYLPAVDIYVDSVNGNNGGSGTITSPLQSLEEALKNIHARRLNGNDEVINIYLSGAVGDIDSLSPVTYTWPNAYLDVSSFIIQSWDDSTTSDPAKLVTGSLWHVQESSNNMTSATGGMLLTLTSSITNLQANFDSGTSGSMADGWFLQEVDGAWPGDSARAIAHAYETASVRVGGVVDEGEQWSLPEDAVEIYKYGTSINFDELLTTGRSVNWNDGEFHWLNLLQDTTTKPLNIISGDLLTRSCFIDLRWASRFGSTMNVEACYIKPAQNIGVQQLGRLIIAGGVWDGADHVNDNKFMRWGGRVVLNNYIVFQNWHEDDSLFFSGFAQIKNESPPGFNDATVVHLTNSSGFSTKEGAVKSPSPTRIIGILNAESSYVLQIASDSTWNWHSGSVVMQSDDITEAKVSVDRAVTSGSADVANRAFILNYSSSTGAYNKFATDWSASYAALLAEAD